MTIQELLERGRAAYLATLSRRYTSSRMPLGTEGVHVVTREDFIVHPEICRAYANTVRALFILDENGSIETLMCRAKPRDG